ncbi:MFS transporter-like protein [Tricladium varicosporioides]|nr:MFS transporter-like protein [Hymenoscyphus varicosporioides]
MDSLSAEGPRPIFLKFRSSTSLILSTVAIALFTDLFLFGLIIPILPFVLEDRVKIPQEELQKYTSILLAVYAGANVLFSLPVGIIADKLNARQVPFLLGLVSLLGSTVMLSMGRSIASLVVARVLQGISAATVWTIGLALMLDTVGSDRLGVTIGSIFSFVTIGELLAPVLGGIVYDKVGNGAVFGMGFVLLGVDFLLRMLLIEKKVARRYGLKDDEDENINSPGIEDGISDSEDSPLLNKKKEEDLSAYTFPLNPSWLTTHLPILYTLRHPRLLTAELVTLTQATILAVFDATIPLEAQSLFGFSSLNAGLLFIPLIAPSLISGPLLGKGVDKYGARPFATFSFWLLSIPLFCLGLPKEITSFSVVLVLAGLGTSGIGSPGVVEASTVMEKFQRVDRESGRGMFGEGGGYAQLYAVNSMVFSAGLTLGPLVAGVLREKIGFGGMGIVFGIVCAVVGCVCGVFLGEEDERWRVWR